MPRPLDGNEPHFVPRAVKQEDEMIVVPSTGANFSPYDLDEICERGWDSRNLGRLIIATLVTHFSDEQNLRFDGPKSHLWRPDPDETSLRIALNTTWDPRTAGMAPSIIVRRLPLKVERVSIGDVAGQDGQGRTFYARHAQTGWKIRIFAQTDGLLEQLTDEVFFMLNAQFAFLRDRWPIHQLEVTGMDGPTPMEKIDHWLTDAVTVSAEFEYNWVRCPPEDPPEVCVSVRSQSP